MMTNLTIQGREITTEDIQTIKSIITTHPTWHRTRISQELCRLWNWKNDIGHLKDIAARSLLRKLDGDGIIKLPQRRRSANNQYRYKLKHTKPKCQTIQEKLSVLQPIHFIQVTDTQQAQLFQSLLAHFHYPGYSGPVGENIRYLIYDCNNRLLGCLLFGAASWNVACRDKFIGWNDQERKKGLLLISGLF